LSGRRLFIPVLTLMEFGLMSEPNIKTTIENQIDQIETLPPFPLLGNILKSFLLADGDGDIRPLISNIETEPSITAKVIGVANSAFFGSSDEIRTIRDATARLGLLQLKSIVYSLVLSSRFKTKQCPHFVISRFWFDSMMQAHCTRHICDQLGPLQKVDRNEAYSIGLLQRIGILALLELSPEKMEFLLAHDTDETISEKILRVYDIDQYTVSAALLRHWLLPESFFSTIQNLGNHEYSGEHQEIVWILQQAMEILRNLHNVEAIKLDARLGLDQNSLCKILNDTEQDEQWIKSFASHL
jgi:HD-like signal output (HDOD) protein